MFRLDGETTIPDGARRSASLVWDEGVFSGDRALVDEATTRIAVAARVKATPSGPAAVAAASPREAAAILAASLFQAFDSSGDFPDELLDVEPGAIP